MHYIDKDGKYLGVFDKAPKGGFKVDVAPRDKRQVFKDGEWVDVFDEKTVKLELEHLDTVLPRWAEDLAEQGGFKLYGEVKEVKGRKEFLRSSLK